MLVKMPYEPLPEDNFEFDEESRTITAYVGTAVDVIIPRTIGGVPVENISYNAFENTRDYVHSDMETNQKEGDWVPMRCVILPETLKSIEDSAFTNLSLIHIYVVIYVPDDQIEEYKKVFEENNKDLNIQPSGKPAVLYSAEDYLDTENLTFDAETGSITGYNGMNTRLTIPESIDGVPVKAIGKRALWEDPLLGYVTLPEGLEYVGEDAFSITDTLKYVEFPSTLKTIDKKGFRCV